jgi:predicted O-methyltransferase YrrM
VSSLRNRLSEFFRRPYGVGAPLNIYMFAPSQLIRHVKTAIKDPRYFIDRARVVIYQVQHPSEPWLTRDALRAIKAFVHPNMRVLEWGSGKSTSWLARHVREVVSVEHDSEWHSRVKVMLSDAGITNTQLMLADAASYAAQASRFPDGFFDLILIDGADRDGCIRAAATKVRPGGWVVVDNAESIWDYSPLANFQRTITHNGVWQTDIFIRT